MIKDVLKYYKGEERNPFAKSDKLKARFWDAEKMFFEICEREESYFDEVKNMLLSAIKKRSVSDKLIDENIPIDGSIP